MDIRKLNPAIRKILADRGIDTDQKAEEYLSPIPQSTYDPFLMKNMDEVCNRIEKAVKDRERICIYGDYDVDGVTSTVLLLEFLGYVTDNVTYYIPSRFEEGYGLNMNACDKMHDDGVSLVITVDNGCAAKAEVSYIKELGMDVIVTDHHKIDPDRKPDCLIIDAKQEGETYPYRDLCGCGTAFKIAQALRDRFGIPKKALNHCLDLAGIATVADVVPLTDENRTLVKYGIDRIKKQERPGINALLGAASVNPLRVNSYEIAFGIGPRINSAGRLRTADTGVALLSASDPETASVYAGKLEELNRERRAIQDSIYKDAVDYIDGNCRDDLFIIYENDDAHEGVMGIAAGKLKEKYNKPVIIMASANEPGFLKGTGRSIEGVDIFNLLNAHIELFERFGGHAAACGFTISRENGQNLREILNRDMKRLVDEDPDLLKKKIKSDAMITAGDVTFELAREVDLMEPFGSGNERPVFFIEGLSVIRVFTMGNERQYRKYICSGGESGSIDAVVFDTDIEGYDIVTAGDTLDVMAEVTINSWNGRDSVQLVIREISARY